MLGVSLFFVQTFVSSSVAFAQEGQQEGLADFSVDLEALPPQPAQTTLPEDEVKPVGDVSPVAPDNVAAPSSAELTPMAPEPGVAAGVEAAEPELKQVPHSGTYYDSDSIVPDPAIGAAVGPREVDPKYEPGSQFVVVKRSAGPDTIPARIVSAQRALKLGRYSSALEMYEQLYKKVPKNKQVLMGLAVAQQQSGFTESAIATYEELLALDPKNTDATVNMLGLLKEEYPAVAYHKLKDLWDKNSQNPALAAQLGLTSASVGNAQDAIRFLGIAATLEPTNPLHFYNMAVISDRAGDVKGAVELYQKALEVDVAYGSGRSIPREEVYDRLATLRRL